MYNIETHGDFKRYFDTKTKKNYWVLGYFGGGVYLHDAYELAKQFSEKVNVPIETVCIDEIFRSRRFKGFKFLFSTEQNQEPEYGTEKMENVFGWLQD